MPLSSGELAQIVWAETGLLGPGMPDGSGSVNGVRRLVAQLAASTDGAGFDKRAPVPATDDPRDGASAAGLIALVEDARNAAPPQNRLIIWEADAGAARPVATPAAVLPEAWTSLPNGVAYQGRFQLAGGRQVDVFSRPALARNDDPVFVNALTGTGLPGGKPLFVQAAGVGTAKRKVGFRLFIASFILCVLAGLWAYGVGVSSRLTLDQFVKTAAIYDAASIGGGSGATPAPGGAAPTACAPDLARDAAGLGPVDWRSVNGAVSPCREKFMEAQQDVIAGRRKGLDQGSLTETFAAWAAYLANARGWSTSLTYPLLMVFVSMILLFVSTGYGLLGRPMGAIIDERNRMSLTLVQLVAWSVVILGGWAVLGLYNIGFGAQDLHQLSQVAAGTDAAEVTSQSADHAGFQALVDSYMIFPSIPAQLMLVLGFAGVTPVISRLISKTSAAAPTPQQDPPQTPDTPPAYLESNADAAQARLTDMVVKEVKTAGSQPLVDVNRVQHVAMTGILVLSYAMMLFGTIAQIDAVPVVYAAAIQNTVFRQMPSIDTTFVTLLGISHATLLGSKYYDKRMWGGTV